MFLNRKKIVYGVAIALIAGANIYASQKDTVELSGLAKANVEALANDAETRCAEEQCKPVTLNITCYYYILDSNNNISGRGEKNPYAYDPNNLI